MHQFFIVGLIALLAAMSPGPDFIMVTRNSLLYSRHAGRYTAIGIGLGLLVHVTYAIVGIGYVISRSLILFSTIKLCGAAYLIYLGICSLRSKNNPRQMQSTPTHDREIPNNPQALKIGFLTNVLNPKASLFMVSLFTQIIKPNTPFQIQIFYGIETALITLLWFIFLATAITHTSVNERLRNFQHHINKVMGVVLIALGIKIAVSTSR